MHFGRNHMIDVVRAYYESCNQANTDGMLATLAPEAVHYFPAGAPQGTFRGARAIANGWRSAVSRLDSRWTIDHLLVDEIANEVVVEWTHWKPRQGVHLRGVEICRFGAEGLISEIRAFYAAPASDPPDINELGDFDYAARGYPMTAPDVVRKFE